MNRQVFLTGGSGGIGAAIAEKFSGEGWKVINPSKKELDLANPESVLRWIEDDRESYDSVVLSAGINNISQISELEFSSIREHLAVNLESNIALLKHILGDLDGYRVLRIVGLSSIYSERSRSGRSQYSVAKAGLEAFIRSIALEFAEKNVLANCVRPGFVKTSLTFKNNSPEQIEAIREIIPLRRLAAPSEIAEVVFFLASESNTYVTGTELRADGGYGIT